MESPPSSPETQRWWGSFDLSPVAAPGGESEGRFATARFKIGPLTVWVVRRVDEWRLAWQRTEGEPPADGAEIACPLPAEEAPGSGLPETAAIERFVDRRAAATLNVCPRLADRSIVSRPDTRFRLAAGDEVELYLGTPLWASFATAEPPSRTLLEVPVVRPSETWFGPSTLDGELCYASRTSARLQRDRLPPKPYRALTRVRLENHGDGDLLFERLNLPVPHLSLYAGGDGNLWTESLTVERRGDGKLAEVRIDPGPPADTGAAEAVAEPRVRSADNVFSRALSALLG